MKRITLAGLLAGLLLAALAGCGSQAQTPQDQVRAVESKMVSALVSDHPEGAIKYYANQEVALAAAKYWKTTEASLTQDQKDGMKTSVAHAPITMNGGDAASLSVVVWGRETIVKFVRINGQWLIGT